MVNDLSFVAVTAFILTKAKFHSGILAFSTGRDTLEMTLKWSSLRQS